MNFTPELTPAEWKALIKVPPIYRSTDMNTFLNKYRSVMEAWIDGEEVEVKVGKEPNSCWRSVRTDKIALLMTNEYRVPPQVTITARLSVAQANAFYKAMEENTFKTYGGIAARNSVMRSIEEELRKAGY